MAVSRPPVYPVPRCTVSTHAVAAATKKLVNLLNNLVGGLNGISKGIKDAFQSVRVVGSHCHILLTTGIHPRFMPQTSVNPPLPLKRTSLIWRHLKQTQDSSQLEIIMWVGIFLDFLCTSLFEAASCTEPGAH